MKKNPHIRSSRATVPNRRNGNTVTGTNQELLNAAIMSIQIPMGTEISSENTRVFFTLAGVLKDN